MRILKEYLPEKILMLPDDIKIPNYGDQFIAKGSEVQYDSYELGNEFVIILHYIRYSNPLTTIKIPILFDSKDDAIAKGFILGETE